MAYYDEFRAMLPAESESFPPYLFGMIDLLKKADAEIAEMKSKSEIADAEIQDAKDKLDVAQRENLDLLNKANQAQAEVEQAQEQASEAIADEVKTTAELLEGGLELII